MVPLEEQTVHEEAVGMTPDSGISDEESCRQKDKCCYPPQPWHRCPLIWGQSWADSNEIVGYKKDHAWYDQCRCIFAGHSQAGKDCREQVQSRLLDGGPEQEIG